MPNALMIHPGECNRAERMVSKTKQPIEHRPRGASVMGRRVIQHLASSAGRSAQMVELSPMGYRPDERFVRIGSTAVVLIDGPIWYDHTGMSWWGGMSTIELAGTFDDIRDDDTIDNCLLDMDSPGGTVAGIDDLITAISALAAAKPTATFIHEMGASLAYWLASRTGKIYGTHSSISGAIGAMSVWYDTSGAAEKHGERAVLITSDAPQKGMGHWGVPFTEDMAAGEQRIIDAMGAMFRSSVTQGRGLSEEALVAMGGATYFGQAQIDQGLVDELITTAQLYDRVLDGTLFADTETNTGPAAGPATKPATNPTPADPAAHAASATPQRTALMDDALKEQITAMTDEEKKEVLALVAPEEEETAEVKEEEEQTAEVKEDEEEEGKPSAMTVTAAKAFLADCDLPEHTVNALAIDAVEKNMTETALLKTALKAQKEVDPEIQQLAQGNAGAIGGHRGGGGGNGGGDATAQYHAKVKETMETFQLSKPQATAKVNRENPELNAAFIAAANLGRVG